MENNEEDVLIKQKLSTEYKVKGLATFSVKDVDMTKRTVDIVINTMNYVDSDMDVLLPGCAKKSLKECGPDSDAEAKIKYAKDHDLTKIVGTWTELSEKEINYKGQNIVILGGSVKLGTGELGTQQLCDYQDGIIDNHSIGFQYVNIKVIQRNAHGNSTQWDTITQELINPQALEGKDYFYAVKEIKLWEGSSVAFGANSLTPYLGCKAENKEGVKLKLFERLEKLNWLMKNDKSVDSSSVFALQIKQIKQIINELSIDFGVTAKQKAIDESIDKIIITPTEPIGINYDFLAKNLKLTS